MTTDTPYLAALVRREAKIQQAELDAASKHCDECAERHAVAMRRLQEARARYSHAREVAERMGVVMEEVKQ